MMGLRGGVVYIKATYEINQMGIKVETKKVGSAYAVSWEWRHVGSEVVSVRRMVSTYHPTMCLACDFEQVVSVWAAFLVWSIFRLGKLFCCDVSAWQVETGGLCPLPP